MSASKSHTIVTILGPTASGKTTLACALAAKINGEVISADSRQVYRFMDIGTGKDLAEYTVNGLEIPYHLINIKEPGYKYNIAEFQIDFIQAFEQIIANGSFPILCGGSGLYIETALKGQDYLGIPADEELWDSMAEKSDDEIDVLYSNLSLTLRQQLNSKTRRRKIRALEISNFLMANPHWKSIKSPVLNPLIIGVDIDRELRRAKITDRLMFRLENGMIEEVKFLVDNYLTFDDLDYYGLEYKWIGKYLSGAISKKEMVEGLNIAIHQFAKRQMTWFRRMEKKGYSIQWIAANEPIEQKLDLILNQLIT